jgi:hypothetical protein
MSGPHTSNVPLLPRGKALLLLVLASVLFLLHVVYYWPWQEDDAFISFRYADNLAGGEGLVFNPGERVEGYSNPAWVLLAAAVLKLGGDPLLTARVVSLLAGLLTLGLAWRLAVLMQPARDRTAHLPAVLAPFVLAVTPLLPRHTTTGLETVVYTALLLACVLLAVDSARNRPCPALPVGLFLLALLRPEGAVFAVLILGWGVTGERLLARLPATWRPPAEPARRPVPEATIFLGLLLVFLVWRGQYYGQLLPNTFTAKMTGETGSFIVGVHYALDFLRENGGPVLAGLYLAVLLRRPLRPVFWLVTLIILAQTVFVILAGGDWMHFYRFFVPVIPLLAAGMGAGLGTVWRRLGPADRSVPRLILIAMLVVAAVNVYKTERAAGRLVMPDVRAGSYLTDAYHETAAWLREHTGPDDAVAVSDIGILGYESRRPIIDMFGLIDPHIARQPGMLHFKNDPAHVLARRPAAVVLVRDTAGGYLRVPDAALAEHREFRQDYRLAHTVEVGFRGEVVEVYLRAVDR